MSDVELRCRNTMSEEFQSFNDPTLRAAVRRVWSDERAPTVLRQRISALVPRQSAGSARRQTEPFSLRLRSALYGLAAAAAFLLAVGIVFNDWSNGRRGPDRAPRAIALPSTSADALFANHDAWAKAPGHRISGSISGNFMEVGQQLHKRLGFPVLAADLSGWTFRGAVLSNVNNTKSGQLFFDSKGKQFVSVFSLPASFVQGVAPGCDYCQANDKHAMAGFATPSGFYCVVGSSTDGTITLDNVRVLRDMLRPTMDNPIPSTPVAAILPR
jgi:hypothetical protein